MNLFNFLETVDGRKCPECDSTNSIPVGYAKKGAKADVAKPKFKCGNCGNIWLGKNRGGPKRLTQKEKQIETDAYTAATQKNPTRKKK